ncbi:hypothetical protein BKN14_02285 [Candidatus Gracilibacteria bacterium HOT-871]|nr:hypothetical protein BKN14_02285 [Candidatus Gracilibacteria bacterium HOT-871]MBF0913756.1 DUF350 domain-containing protein [Candidatus Gracilibacteria bacterium]
MHEINEFLKGPIGTVVYSIIGILIMFLFIVLAEKFTSFSIKKEIIEDENVALGVMFGCLFIAIAIIIAASIV